MSERYHRNELVIGQEGQRRLRNGSVLIIGCGALGGHCSMYLAGAGVGRIGLVDFDVVSESNLQRQLFFREDEIGKSKSCTIANRIAALNSEVETVVYQSRLTSDNITEVLTQFDFVIEATDSRETKYLVASVCAKIGKGVCIGGVRELHGQITTYLPGHLSFNEIFPYPLGSEDKEASAPVILGVLGPTAGFAASVQSAEALKYLSGHGKLLTDKILTFDLETLSVRVVNLPEFG